MIHRFRLAEFSQDVIIFNTIIAIMKGKRVVAWKAVKKIEIKKSVYQLEGVEFILYDGTKLGVRLLECRFPQDDLLHLLTTFHQTI